MLLEIGQCVGKIISQVRGGVLLFFASYDQKVKCLDLWNQYLHESYTHKPLFEEPKSQTELDQVMRNYRAIIKDKNGIYNGCILAGVCRGKISEGIDFANEECRCVFVIGAPCANLGDPKISLKREIMDNKKKKKESIINGDEWYLQDTLRAVNQAIGRVIRHKDDYGAIILVEQRYSTSYYYRYVSKWL